MSSERRARPQLSNSETDEDHGLDLIREQKPGQKPGQQAGTALHHYRDLGEVAAERDSDDPEEITKEETGRWNSLDEVRDELPTKRCEVFEAITDLGECQPGAIKDETGMQASVHKHLSELVEMDVVTRRKHPDDGRKHLYSTADWLTHEGATDNEEEESSDEESSGVDDAGDDVDNGEPATLPEWCDVHPADIADEMPSDRTAVEIVDAFDTKQGWVQIRERLAVKTVRQVKAIAEDLGLLNDSGSMFHPDVEERVADLREVVDQ